jgi:hypothetical protein
MTWRSATKINTNIDVIASNKTKHILRLTQELTIINLYTSYAPLPGTNSPYLITTISGDIGPQTAGMVVRALITAGLTAGIPIEFETKIGSLNSTEKWETYEPVRFIITYA